MLSLNLIMTLGLLAANPPDSAEYRQYEKENLSLFRKRFEFVMPKVELPTESLPPTALYETDPSDTLRATWVLPEGVEHFRDIHRPSGEMKVEGFRVQIYAGTSYDAAKRIKAEYVLGFPGGPVYDTWASPHFRVRVGDFLSRNEALAYVNKIKDKFPGAFVVPDKVKIRKKTKVTPMEDVPPGETPPQD